MKRGIVGKSGWLEFGNEPRIRPNNKVADWGAENYPDMLAVSRYRGLEVVEGIVVKGLALVAAAARHTVGR